MAAAVLPLPPAAAASGLPPEPNDAASDGTAAGTAVGSAVGLVASLRQGKSWAACGDAAVERLLEEDMRRDMLVHAKAARRNTLVAIDAKAANAVKSKLGAAGDNTTRSSSASDLLEWASLRQIASLSQDEAAAREAIESSATSFYEKSLLRVCLIRLYQKEEGIKTLLRTVSDREARNAATTTLVPGGVMSGAAGGAPPRRLSSIRMQRGSIDWHVYRPPPEWLAANLLKRNDAIVSGAAFSRLAAFSRQRRRARGKLKAMEGLLCNTTAATLQRFHRAWLRFCGMRRAAKEAEEARLRAEAQRVRAVHLQSRVRLINREMDHRGEAELEQHTFWEALLHGAQVGMRVALRSIEARQRQRAARNDRAERVLRADRLLHQRQLQQRCFAKLHSFYLRQGHRKRATRKCQGGIQRSAVEALQRQAFRRLLLFSRKRMNDAFRSGAAEDLASRSRASFMERAWVSLKRFLRERRRHRELRAQRARIALRRNDTLLLARRFALLRAFAKHQMRRRENLRKVLRLQERTSESIWRDTLRCLAGFATKRREETERERVRRVRESIMSGLLSRASGALRQARFAALRRFMRQRRGLRLVAGLREAADVGLVGCAFGAWQRRRVVQIARRGNVDVLLLKHSAALLGRYYRRWKRPARRIAVASGIAVRRYKASLLEVRTQRAVLHRFFRSLLKHYLAQKLGVNQGF